MKCPGQDSAYWQGERVFEVPCMRCGAKVEFFRDEVSRRCSRCSYRLNNPRVALDCATWCDQAESCTGLSRSRIAAIGQGAPAVAGKLIEALEEAMPDKPDLIHQALLVFQHARELAPAAPLPPVTFLSAALLLEVSDRLAAAPGAAGLEACREILARAALDEPAIAAIATLIKDYWKDPLSPRREIQLLHDSVVLAKMSQTFAAAGHDVVQRHIEEALRTDPAQNWARSLFLVRTDEASAANG